MLDIPTTLFVLAGFAFIFVVGAKLGAGSTDSLAGLFAYEPMPPRPRGVQETELPRFVFRDAPVSAVRGTAAPAAGRAYGTSAA